MSVILSFPFVIKNLRERVDYNIVGYDDVESSIMRITGTIDKYRIKRVFWALEKCGFIKPITPGYSAESVLIPPNTKFRITCGDDNKPLVTKSIKDVETTKKPIQ